MYLIKLRKQHSDRMEMEIDILFDNTKSRSVKINNVWFARKQKHYLIWIKIINKFSANEHEKGMKK